MRCPMCHAVFWVTPSVRASSHELMPFFALTMSQTAGIHLSKPRGESSKIVPTFTVNCFLQVLQLLTIRLPENLPTSLESQCGQRTPLDQRSLIRNSWQLTRSPK